MVQINPKRFKRPTVGKDRNGLPVIHLWEAPVPDPDKSHVGFPLAAAADHVTLFKSSYTTGAYNHHPQLIPWGKRIFALAGSCWKH